MFLECDLCVELYTRIFWKLRLWKEIPLLARSLAVSLPIPVLAPVMITVLPSSLAVEDHWPLKNALWYGTVWNMLHDWFCNLNSITHTILINYNQIILPCTYNICSCLFIFIYDILLLCIDHEGPFLVSIPVYILHPGTMCLDWTGLRVKSYRNVYMFAMFTSNRAT